MFRTLRADEIDLRVQNIKENGFMLLLYKDARADMNILDETVGAMYWKREHTRNNANCIVSIWNKEIGQWISKEDTGVESFSEKEKGLASDSFKRSCVNWGIGKELYTAPFVWINNEGEVKKTDKGKLTVYEKFTVSEIEYDDHKRITKLIVTDSKGKVRYSYGAPQAPQKAVTKKKVEQVASTNKEPEKASEGFICNKCGVEITKKVNDYSEKNYGKALCMTCQKGE